MKYPTAILGVLFFAAMFSGVAMARKHGATLTWAPAEGAATCKSHCKAVYLIFEGPGSGKEDMSKPFASTNKLRFVDDEPKQGAYGGTTRCYVVQCQLTIRMRVVVGESSGETCVNF
jgi:hypothetical protein